MRVRPHRGLRRIRENGQCAGQKENGAGRLYEPAGAVKRLRSGDGLYVDRLRALAALLHVELHSLTFCQ